MFNKPPIDSTPDEFDRNAYNAAFYELGLRWYWDIDTYEQLMRRQTNPTERIRHYLETFQSHLLKAYDVAFLANVIQSKKAEHRGNHSGTWASGHFDWARTLDCEIGV